MDFIQVAILAIIQGITEFLPVSSSAHLALVPALTGWQDQGLVFDVALHLGSLTAVLIYFRQDIKTLTIAGLKTLSGHGVTTQSKLFFAVGFATIPVGLAGLLLNDLIETNLRSPVVIGVASIVFGLALYAGDKWGKKERSEKNLTWKDVLMIGLAQAVALIPGTSRSGATMTMGLMMGLTRQAAARFSFLLSIPVIILAGGFKSLDLIKNPIAFDWSLLILAIVLSAFVAWLCIHYFLKLLDQYGMLPFVIYRVLLGLMLLFLFL